MKEVRARLSENQRDEQGCAVRAAVTDDGTYHGWKAHAQALMAYNCLHRGSSTLLCNLWKEMDAESAYPEPWMDQYGKER